MRPLSAHIPLKDLGLTLESNPKLFDPGVWEQGLFFPRRSPDDGGAFYQERRAAWRLRLPGAGWLEGGILLGGGWG